MKKIYLLVILLFVGIIVLSSCAQAPTPNQEIDPTGASPATQTVFTPTTVAVNVTATASPTATETAIPPTPTAQPVIPCNIVFESDRDGNLEIYTMSPDGANQENRSNHPAGDFDPVWSPDGTRIAFVSNRGDGVHEGQFIFVMAADGSDVVQVSQESESKFPDWSPAGNQIAYSSRGEIYLLDLTSETETNLSNSPEWDEQPKISPDGQRILWLLGEEGSRQVFVMDLDGGNKVQVTQGGNVGDASWSVDGRIFAHWNQPDGICFNCILSADGKDIQDAGGKGEIQEYLPFWTIDGARVEMVAGDIQGTGREDIFLVGENFPDLFFFLTRDAANNRNPDAPFLCGPERGSAEQVSSTEPAETGVSAQSNTAERFTIGYTGSINPMMQKDFDTACAELDVNCVHGENIQDLIEQRVDAIVNASNRWDVMGSYPAIHEAAEQGIPFFNLNAEINEPGVYNLSAEHEIYRTVLNWMFQKMNGQGEFVYYNVGGSEYIQNEVDSALKDYPVITAVKKEADYQGNTFSEQDITKLVEASPNLGAIWSSEPSNNIFWGINNAKTSQYPLAECLARKDELIAWKNIVDGGSTFQCMAFIRPGGTAYEGIYAAFYSLSGYKFKTDAFFPGSNNTLRYDFPVITNVELPDWIGDRMDALRVGDSGFLQLPPMSAEEIKAMWFEE